MLAFLPGKEAASSLTCSGRAPWGRVGAGKDASRGSSLAPSRPSSTTTSPVYKQLVFAQVLTGSLVEAPVDSEPARSVRGIPRGAGTPPSDRGVPLLLAYVPPERSMTLAGQSSFKADQ